MTDKIPPKIGRTEITGTTAGKDRDSGDQMTEFCRQRLERDLLDLKKLIVHHFEQRKEDEGELDNLRNRIDARKDTRQEQLRTRQERIENRNQLERAEAERKAKMDQEKLVKEEERKKELMLIMSMNCGGYQAQQKNRKKGKNAQMKDEKKKVLSERRKILNVDHLQGEKLQEKAIALHQWLMFLEEDKFDNELKMSGTKLEIKQMRQRINDIVAAKKTSGVSLRK